MPGFSNSIHQTTIYGQIYRRGVNPIDRPDFVRTTMHNFGMLRQIHRFDRSTQRGERSRIIY